MDKIRSPPSVTPIGSRIRGTGSVHQDLNSSPSVQLNKLGHKSQNNDQPGQRSVEPRNGHVTEFCSVCGESRSKCDPLTLEENEVLEEFIQKPFPLSSLGVGNSFFKKYKICSGCSANLEKLARWKKEIDQITHNLTTIARRRQINPDKTVKSSSNVQEQVDDKVDEHLERSSNDGAATELEITDNLRPDPDGEVEMLMVTSSAEQPIVQDGRQSPNINKNSERNERRTQHIVLSTEVEMTNTEQAGGGGNVHQCNNDDVITRNESRNPGEMYPSPDEINGRPLCSLCGKSYSRLHDLLRHQRKVHKMRIKLGKRKVKRNRRSKRKLRSTKSQSQDEQIIQEDQLVAVNILNHDEDEQEVKAVVVDMEFDIMEDESNSGDQVTITPSNYEDSHILINESDSISDHNNEPILAIPQRRSRILAEERLQSMAQAQNEGEDDKCGQRKRSKVPRTPISENNVRQLQDQAPAPTNSKVKCDVCLLIFKSETGYGQHLSSMLHSIGMKNRRRDEYCRAITFQCDTCGRSFSSVKPLRKHLIEIHGARAPPREKISLRCEPCNHEYANRRRLQEHLNTDKHTLRVGGVGAVADLQGRKRLECSTCHRKYVTAEMLRSHISKAHKNINTRDQDAILNEDTVVIQLSDWPTVGQSAVKNPQQVCPQIPGMHGSSLSSLAESGQIGIDFGTEFEHTTERSLGTDGQSLFLPESERTLQCYTCHKRFMTPEMMRSHIKSVHRKKKRLFQHGEDITSDSQDVVGDEVTSGNLEQEMSTAEIMTVQTSPENGFGNARIRCDPCNQDYSSYKRLNQHLITDKHVQNVAGEEGLAELEKRKRFQCHDCKKMFMSPLLVRKHAEKVHTNVKIRCEPCNKDFKSSNKFKEHSFSDAHAITVGGPDALEELEKQKPFRCHICNRKYMTHQMYQNHLRSHRTVQIRRDMQLATARDGD